MTDALRVVMSGKVSSNIRVRFDAQDAHVKSTIITCRVIERLGYNEDARTFMAVVEHNGKELTVVHTMVRGTWRPWTPQDRAASLTPPASSRARQP